MLDVAVWLRWMLIDEKSKIFLVFCVMLWLAHAAFACPVGPIDTISFRCAQVTPTTFRVTMPSFTTTPISILDGFDCDAGLRYTDPIWSVDQAEVVDAVSGVPLSSFAYVLNADVSACLHEVYSQEQWQGFRSPLLEDTPGGVPVEFVFDLTTSIALTCDDVLWTLRNVVSWPNVYSARVRPEQKSISLGGFSCGDPHWMSLDGYLYEFHAPGDFIAITDGGSFMIQTRQEAWHEDPRLGFTAEIAMRVGDIRVELNGRASPPLTIDGIPTNIGSPRTLPGGGRITAYNTLRGQVFDIYWPTGEHAEVLVGNKQSLMDLRVFGLPASTTHRRGLMGNGDGNPYNDLEARGGRVLPKSPSYDQFMNDFALTWRVRPEESLFTHPPAGHATEGSSPDWNPYSRPVTPIDLAPGQRTQAEGICLGQGIVHPALLAACIVDVGATGNPDYAKRLAVMPPPREVLTFDRPAPARAGSDLATSRFIGVGTSLGCSTAGSTRPDATAWLLAMVLFGLSRGRRRSGGKA